MSIEVLKQSLEYLVTKYVKDAQAQAEIRTRIENIQPANFPPVKGIMADIHSHIVEADPKDADLFHQIGFYYL